jgi:hypothetical protein
MQNYSEVYSKLNYETAAIVFLKKDGTVRLMLGTRNLRTVELNYGFQGKALGGHDNRCNIGNGNIAVFDLILGEARSFNIERLQAIYYMGELDTQEKLDKAANEFMEFKTEYEKSQSSAIDMDMLD